MPPRRVSESQNYSLLSDNAVPSQASSPPSPLVESRQKWRIRTPDELRKRSEELGSGNYIVDGLVPRQSLAIVVGDSGLGKSPLLYQASINVASGTPFLGYSVAQGPVLYLDFENGIEDVTDTLDRIAQHSRLPKLPDNLFLWNYNDAPSLWQPETLAAMIALVKPVLTVIDSLTAFAPYIEEKSSNVTQTYQELRRIIQSSKTAIVLVHHLRKPSPRPGDTPVRLESDPQKWLRQARGSGALINGSDVRLGVDRWLRAGQLPEKDGLSREAALALAGFSRIRGNVTPKLLARVYDNDDRPLGYDRITGRMLLVNEEQIEAYGRLPETFRFKDAETAYERGPQATNDFLQKCLSLGILKRDATGYRKLESAEQAE